MYIKNSQIPQPILSVSQKTLDFGLVSAGEPAEGHGIAKLTITNDGDRILVGRIAIQVAWVTVDPPDFRLNPGESSEHIFTVRQNVQFSWTTRRMGSDFIALINSNGGSETIGGYYFLDSTKTEKKKKPIHPWLYALIPIFILLTAGIILFVSRQNEAALAQQKTENSDSLYTRIAETYFAEMTENPTIISTEPPPQNTPNPLVVPNFDITPSPAPSMTFTPWVAADYPNVEEFIRTYYKTLNERDYETAWWMLSEKMQQACCYTGEANPITVYQNYWDKVESVEVNYAFLQSYDTNPAIVNVGLTYHYKDGTTEETVNQFSIITDDVKKSLVIDEIR